MTDTVHVYLCDSCGRPLDRSTGWVAILGTPCIVCVLCWSLHRALTEAGEAS